MKLSPRARHLRVLELGTLRFLSANQYIRFLSTPSKPSHDANPNYPLTYQGPK